MISKGPNRVIIENVQPLIENGRHPAKSTVGETVTVTADIFADGHDYLRTHLMLREPGSKKEKELEMDQLPNDVWECSFITDKKGIYKFTIEGWVDHLLTWHNGFIKKAQVGQHLELEISEGVNLLKEVSKKQSKADKEKIKPFIDLLSDKKNYNTSVQTVLGHNFKELVRKFPLKKHVSRYNKELEIDCEFKKANFSSWYEFFPRSASQDQDRPGTFKDCEALLPRVASMGFDVLYFPPIHPVGELHRKGKNNSVTAEKGEPGSPWAIGNKDGGHKSVNPELGTLEDFKRLVDKARKKGIEVAMDIAFQCAPDHPYVKEHPEWFKWRPDGSVQYAENPPKKYQDILPFDFESDAWESLWEELKSVFFYWIDQGITIFRVDNPHTKPISFWEYVIAEINKKYDDIIFLSEAFTRPKIMGSLAKVGFTQSYTYFTWRNTKAEMMEYMNELVNTKSRYYFRPNFWPNTPDILPYVLQNEGENAFISRYAMAATLSSNFGVYGPVYEFYDNKPVPGKEEYWNSEKYEIKHHDWNKTNRMTDIMTALNKARKENEALQSTWNITFCEIHNDQLLAYLKVTPDLSNIILVVVNMDSYNSQSGHVRVPLDILKVPHSNINLKLTDLITEDHYNWTQEWNYVELNPNALPFHLFKIEIE
ncbi:MAG: alpha-1,4-glucan--maltose-1-phosphate maltosyltransferase [Candidatus Cyclobacteriaceae bacterium M2_1C_046]